MAERLCVLILEDDARRTAAMRACLDSRFPEYVTWILPDAPAFIAAFQGAPERVLAVSLDHDLEPQSDGPPDPGTGRDVADFLVEMAPRQRHVPILIHSTNICAVDGMERVLGEAGYQVVRVAPYGDLDWIDEAWFPAFRRLIRDAVRDGSRAKTNAEQ